MFRFDRTPPSSLASFRASRPAKAPPVNPLWFRLSTASGVDSELSPPARLGPLVDFARIPIVPLPLTGQRSFSRALPSRNADTTTQGTDPEDQNVPFAMVAPVVEASPNAQAPPNPVQVTVKMNGPHEPTSVEGKEQAKKIQFTDANYASLYSSVSDRASTMAEAGFERATPTVNLRTKQETAESAKVVVGADYTIDLEIGLPEWTTKAAQPKEDQQRFDQWQKSVERHEQAHANQDRLGLPRRLKEAIRGPSEEEVDEQEKEVLDRVNEFQAVIDKIAQPQPLAAPGGTTKIP